MKIFNTHQTTGEILTLESPNFFSAGPYTERNKALRGKSPVTTDVASRSEFLLEIH